jgi:hypothetical protein
MFPNNYFENKNVCLIRSKSLNGSASTKNIVSSMISKKLQNHDDEIGNRTLSWNEKKNICNEEEGADGPNGDPVCISQDQNQIF